MKYEQIIYQKEGNTGILTLNRPERLNALSRQLTMEMSSLLDEIERDNKVKAIIITGGKRNNGKPCFSAGADLKEISTVGPMTLKKQGMLGAVESLYAISPIETELQLVFDRIESSSGIFIAAIDGVCTAGGLELALSCDIRTVSETAEVSDMHVKNIGRIGGAGATTRLTRAIGPAMAKELCCTGDVINGQEAVRIGFANHCYPPDKLLEETLKIAQKIASRNENGVRMTKASVNASVDLDLRQALRHSYLCWIAGGGGTPGAEATEGARAFTEKRPPKF